MTAATLDPGDLAEALTWVAKAVPTRPAAPALAAIKLTFTDGWVTAAAFDYETSHAARVPASVTEPGEILVPGHLAAHMVASLKGDTVHLEPGSGGWGLVVTAGRTTFHLPELPPGDYPALPKPPPGVGRVPARQLQALVRTADSGRGRDDMLPVLTALHVVGEQDTLTVTATDRFRVHRASCRWEPVEEFAAVVPGRGLKAAVDGMRGMVEIGWSTSQLRLTTDDRTFIIRLFEDVFPKVGSLIPALDGCVVVADVDVDELRAALARAALALERNTAVNLSITADTVELTAALAPGAATGAAADSVDANVTTAHPDGPSYQIGFNPTFLTDALGCLGTRRALIGFQEPTHRPALLLAHDPDRPADQVPDTVAVLMPRRVLS